jgi:hypothetical protein
LGTCIGIVGCCTEIELPNILVDTFFASSWRGMGNNGGDIIIYALGNFPHYGSLYPPKQ